MLVLMYASHIESQINFLCCNFVDDERNSTELALADISHEYFAIRRVGRQIGRLHKQADTAVT